MILKGQNFRILTLVSSKWKCVGMATNCTVNLTNNTDDGGTKDDVGMASKPTMTSPGWNVQLVAMPTHFHLELTSVRILKFCPFKIIVVTV